MKDQVVFRHPSGALAYATERGADEYARMNPEWERLDHDDLEELARPGIRDLLEIMAEVSVKGVEGRNVVMDYDRLRQKMVNTPRMR